MTDDLPHRPAQHVAEDASKLVLQQCLPDHWIFRDLGTKNDYGIDSEVELVSTTGEVSGTLVRIQLKGREKVSFTDEGRASAGGIKQSTLRYWLELSRRTGVGAVLTDNSAQRAYFTPIFWQAARAIDGSGATKTLHFKHDIKVGTTEGVTALVSCALDRPWARIRALEEILHDLPALLHDYLWNFQADPWIVNEQLGTFRRWLRVGKELVQTFTATEEARLFNEQHWIWESERVWGDHIMYDTLRTAYTETFRVVFPIAREVVEHLTNGKHYWSTHARDCLLLAESVPLPAKYDWDSIGAFVQEHRIEAPR